MAATMRRLLILALGAALPALAADPAFDAATVTNRLGLDLFRQLAAASPTGNLVLSPYSIASALALAYAGTDGATRSEMGAALRFPAEDAPLITSFGILRTSLNKLGRSSTAAPEARQTDDDDEKPIEWQQINLLLGQRGYDFQPRFLALLKQGYGAPFEPIDFRTDAEAGRRAINTWVGEQTHGKSTISFLSAA